MKDVFVCDQAVCLTQVRAENQNIHYSSFLETQQVVQKQSDLVHLECCLSYRNLAH